MKKLEMEYILLLIDKHTKKECGYYGKRMRILWRLEEDVRRGHSCPQERRRAVLRKPQRRGGEVNEDG